MKKNIRVNMYEYSFPLMGGKYDDDGDFEILNIVGTAFHIGGNYFITAGHVVEQLKTYTAKAMLKVGELNGDGVPKGQEIVIFDKYEDKKEFEIIKEKDIGILYLVVNPKNSLLWSLGNYFPPELFRVFGYPFSFDKNNNEITIRSITGNIVSVRNFRTDTINSRVYELSAICPKGISGAFLLEDSKLNIIGLIIGNSSSEIEICYEEETSIENKNKTVFMKSEVIKYGIAITNQEIYEIYSVLLENNILDHLKNQNLIQET